MKALHPKIKAKIKWLLENKELWENLDEHCWLNNRQQYNMIVNKMRDIGLISKTTVAIDVNLSNLIKRAKEFERFKNEETKREVTNSSGIEE